MATILPLFDKHPQFGKNCFVAPNATIIGDVIMGGDCSIWFNAVVRGDVHYIRIGNKVNIQDGAVIHCTYEKNPTNIGNNVSIGHNAIVHGCTVRDNVSGVDQLRGGRAHGDMQRRRVGIAGLRAYHTEIGDAVRDRSGRHIQLHMGSA